MSNNTAQAGAATSDTANEVHHPLDQLVASIIASGNQDELNQKLKGIDVRDPVWNGVLSTGEDPLTTLDVATHTLGYLYILTARLSELVTAPPMLQYVEAFCGGFNPEHARLASDRVTLLAKALRQALEDSGNLQSALSSLRNLVMRYPPTPSHLTNIHPIFLSACVSTRNFAAALPVLSEPILHIDTSLCELTYNDNLVYHYAGGVVLGVLKRWREAAEFFEIAVSSPAQMPAAIQFEALKKLSLVQMILYGKASIPKYTSSVLSRLYKSSAYSNLSKVYPQKISTLNAIVSREAEVFTMDKNRGLVQQVVEHAPRWLIRRLTSTYLTLGLGDIAKEIGLESADQVRAVILDMVKAREIRANISEDGTVIFSDSTPNVSKADIDRALVEAQRQSKLLLELERAMNVSKEYLVKAIKHKDEAWGTDEDIYSHTNLSSGGAWADDFM